MPSSSTTHGVLLLLVGCVWSEQMPPWASDRPVVELPAGRFRAERLQVDGGSYLQLRGIQYAQHPLGDLRWQPPQPLDEGGAQREVIDATRWGADCINAPWTYRLLDIGFSAMSEACLFLNVWAPEPFNGTAGRPVMFWIHGGSFVTGGTSAYPGSGVMELRRDVVLVSANYRLGALGFLGGAAVARSSRDGSAGNFGLQDTREALRWVQRNIRALGGDPGRVTIFGESAGATLVASHLVAPRSAGLFAGAIMQSGAFDNYTVQEDPDGSFRLFADLAGCASKGDDDGALACLRRRPLDAIFHSSLLPAIANTSSAGIFSPAVDRIELSASPEVLAARGQINRVDGVILGTNENEGRFLMPLQKPVPGAPRTTEAQFRQWLRDQFSAEVSEEVMKRYPASDFNGSYWRAAARVFTDSEYFCPTARSARWLIQSGRVPRDQVFVYQFRYEPLVYGLLGDALYWWEWCKWLTFCHNATNVPIGVGHFADVLLVWNLPHALRTPEDHEMAKYMVDRWQLFAQSFTPNEHRLRSTSDWPPFADMNQTMLLQPESFPSSNFRQDICDFWDWAHAVPYPSGTPRGRLRAPPKDGGRSDATTAPHESEAAVSV